MEKLIVIGGSWPENRGCADMSPSNFFYDGNGASVSIDVLEMCDACPIRDMCAEFAVENEEAFGAWGGLLTAEIKRIISARGERLFRNRQLFFRNEIPTCQTRIGPTVKGFRTHIDNGEMPCSGCRTVYRKQQRASESRRRVPNSTGAVKI